MGRANCMNSNSPQIPIHSEEIQARGFAVIPGVLDEATVAGLIDQLQQIPRGRSTKQRGQSYFGIRNLLTMAPYVYELANSPCIRSIVDPIAGAQARVVRGIFFDKTPEANWKVAWHQDLSIAVQQRKELAGFKCWSNKAGVTHVQPPTFVLEKILAVRLHLDATNENNGALRVIPKSHRYGRLGAVDIQKLKREGQAVVCSVEKGGALAMSPLLLHSSSVSLNTFHRRVIHLEFTSIELPGGLEWCLS
jgi:hypothetical protein